MNQKVLIPNPEDRIMCVKVGKVKRENLYEMTRKGAKTRQIFQLNNKYR